ncbi:acyl-CoA dehydrogenase family protein [Bacillus paralicheniformis]|uniref:acyl-CoA dehydrogenase family protein n=1 Tax=Bacillus paralicheniformis TaxID=1648923 RepID=UPI0021A7277E|nr:acyl-CoA dehydrogenase family protein [Bacillus paralicheniformis]UWS62938.1 acyl-CoA dehydrogenase family protein [Bacillus paralicheniformis]
MLKGVLTDKGFEHAVMAQQVFGGHGYIEEHGMSQYVRDARIAMIYEGANGIQALDLVGRKLALNGGTGQQGSTEWLSSPAHLCCLPWPPLVFSACQVQDALPLQNGLYNLL